MSKSKPRWSPPPDHSGDADAADDNGATLLLDSHAAELAQRTRGKISPAGWHKASGRTSLSSKNVDTSDLVYAPDPDFGKKGGR